VDIIVLSLVMVIILKPVYSYIERLLRGRSGLAVAATLLALFLAILIPSWITYLIVANQVNDIRQSLRETSVAAESGGWPHTSEEFQMRVNARIEQLPLIDQLAFLRDFRLTDENIDQVREVASAATSWLSQTLINLGMTIPSLIARLFIFMAIVGVLLPNYHRFVQRLLDLSPLDDEVDRLFLRKIKAMVWSMFLGILVIALLQGLITGVFIWLGGVAYAPLWTLLAIVVSALPLGAGLIVIPIAIFQLIMGKPLGALIVLGGYAVVVSNLDNILRPRLVSKEAYLNAAMVLLGALGGYNLFGFFGVIYGPVLLVMMTTCIDVYGTYYADRKQPAVETAGEGETNPDEVETSETAASGRFFTKSQT
jgi:predicted PurR-regulated permease PerM